MSEATLSDVLAAVQSLSGQVETLAGRLETLESELAAVRGEQSDAQVPPEVMIAISAAVAAFLGHRARLTHVRYRTGGDAWTQHGRAAVHRHTAFKGVR